jgi:ABC-type transporter Mla subunit MlaD
MAAFSEQILLMGVGLGVTFLVFFRWIQHLNRKAAILSGAADSLEEFYDSANAVLEDASTPDYVRGFILHLIKATLNDHLGRQLINIVVNLREYKREVDPSSPFSVELETLRKDNPQLVADIANALNLALAGMIYNHCYEHDKIMLNVIKQQPYIVSLAAQAMQKMFPDGNSQNGGYSDNGGFAAAHTG